MKNFGGEVAEFQARFDDGKNAAVRDWRTEADGFKAEDPLVYDEEDDKVLEDYIRCG